MNRSYLKYIFENDDAQSEIYKDILGYEDVQDAYDEYALKFMEKQFIDKKWFMNSITSDTRLDYSIKNNVSLYFNFSIQCIDYEDSNFLSVFSKRLRSSKTITYFHLKDENSQWKHYGTRNVMMMLKITDKTLDFYNKMIEVQKYWDSIF